MAAAMPMAARRLNKLLARGGAAANASAKKKAMTSARMDGRASVMVRDWHWFEKGKCSDKSRASALASRSSKRRLTAAHLARNASRFNNQYCAAPPPLHRQK